MAKYAGYSIGLEYDADGMPTWTNIGQIRDFEPPSTLSETIDASTHDSAANWRRDYVSGLLDLGEMTFELAYDPADAGHTWLRNNGPAGFNDFRIIFPDSGGTSWVFSGQVTNFQPKNPVEGLQTADVTIKCKGAITVA